jgi:hypothetical protein
MLNTMLRTLRGESESLGARDGDLACWDAAIAAAAAGRLERALYELEGASRLALEWGDDGPENEARALLRELRRP